ncbi:hypothetical protein [Streptacidiphilus sp. P02-A3a]|uniref:hypothetical protein n=1 Tax=Streptacidiphilus sp. P02-A3a TaxID=2704468 RepID=UPI0015FE2282|nr:hypothetical protein [Streptacidiphilus sp. P02-A3a]QMU69386.1 hypothetical protein GXP74_15220 [Streptacidiphilus sp. P02-A3a]
MDQPPRSWAEVLAGEQQRLDRAVARAQAGYRTLPAGSGTDPAARPDDSPKPS